MLVLGIHLGEAVTSWARSDGAVDNAAFATGSLATRVGVQHGGALVAGRQLMTTAPGAVLVDHLLSRLGQVEPVNVKGTPYGTESLLAVVLAAVRRDSATGDDGVPDVVAVTADGSLDPYRAGLLVEALRLAGLPVGSIELVPLEVAQLAGQPASGLGAPGARLATGAAIEGSRRRGTSAPATGATSTGVVVASGAGATVGAAAVTGATASAASTGAGTAAAGTAGAAAAGTPLAAPGVATAGSPLASTSAYQGVQLAAPGTAATGAPASTASTGYAGTTLPPASGVTGGGPGTATAAERRRPRLRPKGRIIVASTVAAVAVAAVTVAAVGSDSAHPLADPTTTIERPPPTTAPTSTLAPVTSPPPATTVRATTAPVSTAPTPTTSLPPPTTAPSLLACAVGRWVLRNADLAAADTAATASAGAVGFQILSVDGTATLQIDPDGTLRFVYDAFRVTASGARGIVVEDDFTGTSVSHGEFHDDGTVTFTGVSTDLQILVKSSINGTPLPDSQQPMNNTFVGTSTITCSGAVLTLQLGTQTSSITADRAP
jgi:hypothetical protein